mmetsp:Transcript_102477/g.330639  ORF Transcript_102477/g.330639 Transcript_102477/m.330639 type:complete len:343 (+) Transcript_102477:74-1102(+)
MALVAHGQSRALQAVLEFLGDEASQCLSNVKRDLLGATRPKQPRVLRELRRGPCSAAFDAGSPETARLLAEVWNAAFPAEPVEAAVDGEQWKRLGFQSCSPRTDIRTGRLALHQLHHLATSRPRLFRRLVEEASAADGYPLACACFNVTQLIVSFFDLSRQPCLSPVPGAATANPSQMRHLAHLCKRSADAEGGAARVLDELFCALAEGLHRTWARLRAERGLGLLDFGQALREVHEAHARFWQRHHQDLSEFCVLALGEGGQAAPRMGKDPCAVMSMGVSAFLADCYTWAQETFNAQQAVAGTWSQEASPSYCCSKGRDRARRRRRSVEEDPPLFGGRRDV